MAELEKRGPLFQCLQIVVKNIKSWSKDDVDYNLKGGSFWSHEQEPTESAIINIRSGLAAQRTYHIVSLRAMRTF